MERDNLKLAGKQEGAPTAALTRKQWREWRKLWHEWRKQWHEWRKLWHEWRKLWHAGIRPPSTDLVT